MALHPFVAIDGHHPETGDRGKAVESPRSAPEGFDLPAWQYGEAEDCRSGKALSADESDELQAQLGKPVRWREMCNLVGCADHRALDRAEDANIRVEKGFS